MAAGLHVARYTLRPPAWRDGLPLRVVALSDFHICEPWMNAKRLAAICAQANALQPDVIVLLGDFLDGPRFSRPVPMAEWAGALRGLAAPLGIHAILGNHDYDGEDRHGPDTVALAVEQALGQVGIPVYINRAVRLAVEDRGFWLAGLGDQYAFHHRGPIRAGFGLDDLSGTLAQVTTDEPVILLAHEPDIFPDVPDRVALTLSGHTHGGQVRLFGRTPVVPSRYGSRYVHGHVAEGDRHLIVSAGLGYSGLPLRIGAVPEIVLIELGMPA